MQMAIALGAKLMASAGTAMAAGKAAMGMGAAAGAGGMGAAAGAGGIGGASASGIASVAAAAGKAGAGASLLSKLQMGATALSAFSSFAGGMSDRRLAQEQALEARYGARQSILQGVQQSNEILDGVVNEMARTRVAYAAAGVDPFSGTPQDVIGRIGRDGERDMEISRSDALVRYLSARRSMRALEQRGRSAGLRGIVGAAASVAGGLIDLKERG